MAQFCGLSSTTTEILFTFSMPKTSMSILIFYLSFVCTSFSAGDNWPEMKKSNGEATFDWPGNNGNSKFHEANAFPVQWDQMPTKDTSSGRKLHGGFLSKITPFLDTDDWACFPKNSSTPKKSEDEDEWADFSTMKSEQSLASDRYSDWPGVDAEVRISWY